MTVIIICATVIAVSMICASVFIRDIEKDKYERSCPFQIDSTLYDSILKLQRTAERLEKKIQEAEK